MKTLLARTWRFEPNYSNVVRARIWAVIGLISIMLTAPFALELPWWQARYLLSLFGMFFVVLVVFIVATSMKKMLGSNAPVEVTMDDGGIQVHGSFLPWSNYGRFQELSLAFPRGITRFECRIISKDGAIELCIPFWVGFSSKFDGYCEIRKELIHRLKAKKDGELLSIPRLSFVAYVVVMLLVLFASFFWGISHFATFAGAVVTVFYSVFRGDVLDVGGWNCLRPTA